MIVAVEKITELKVLKQNQELQFERKNQYFLQHK